jgi:hypothetical protein
MLFTCWSVKGGSGTSVVAASLALVLARPKGLAPLARPSASATLVDLDGDAPGVLGLAEPGGPGLVDWFDTDADPNALDRLLVEVSSGLHLLPRGSGPLPEAGPRWTGLAEHLVASGRPVVVDGGSHGPPPGELLSVGTSVLVVRPCYLALRRVARLAVRPDRVVMVDEPGRALRRADVEAVVGVPVAAHLELDPAVARAVDAGLLAGRLPSQLHHGLRRVA